MLTLSSNQPQSELALGLGICLHPDRGLLRGAALIPAAAGVVVRTADEGRGAEGLHLPLMQPGGVGALHNLDRTWLWFYALGKKGGYSMGEFRKCDLKGRF